MNCNLYTILITLTTIISLIWFMLYQIIGQMNSNCLLKVHDEKEIVTHSDNVTIYADKTENFCTSGVKCFQKCSFQNIDYKSALYCRPNDENIVENGSFDRLMPYYITNIISLNNLCYQNEKYCLVTTEFVDFNPELNCGTQNIRYKHVNNTLTLLHNRYCVLNESAIFACFLDIESMGETNYSALVGMNISLPFLLVTFMVFLMIPDTNIHKRATMFYMVCLLIPYFFLIFLEFTNPANISKKCCIFIGSSILFFLIASFFWMNVISVDMWLAFRSFENTQENNKNRQLKNLMVYFLYAMGIPLLFVVFIILMNTYLDQKSVFHPQIASRYCFLEEGLPEIFYYYLPISIIVGINIILYVKTALRIYKIHSETSILKQNHHSNEIDMWTIFIKLLMMMGIINWSSEIISWMILWKLKTVPIYIWYFPDFMHGVYSAFLFFTFVVKHKMWISIREKCARLPFKLIKISK